MFISDMHGASPVVDIQNEIASGGIEKLVCLGDYDTPEILRELLRLDIPKKLVVGNHDYGYVKNTEVKSIEMGKKTFKDYVALWDQQEFLFERNFIASASDEKDLSRNAGLILNDVLCGEKVSYAHCGFIDVVNPFSEFPECLRTRMHWVRDSEKNIVANFERMQEDDTWILFRGHEHTPLVFSIYRNFPAECTNIDDSATFRVHGGIILNPKQNYIISVGAFIEGQYAIFDTDNRKLEFRYALPKFAPQDK